PGGTERADADVTPDHAGQDNSTLDVDQDIPPRPGERLALELVGQAMACKQPSQTGQPGHRALSPGRPPLPQTAADMPTRLERARQRWRQWHAEQSVRQMHRGREVALNPSVQRERGNFVPIQPRSVPLRQIPDVVQVAQRETTGAVVEILDLRVEATDQQAM